MTTLLEICQVAAEEVGFTAPTSIIGNTNTTAKRLLRIANRTGKSLAKYPWAELRKPKTFSTTISEPQYALPSDFRSMVNDTVWNQTTDRPIYLINSQDWAYEKSATTANFYDRYRLVGDDSSPTVGKKFTLLPTPDAVETIYYEYFSKNWVMASGGASYKAEFTDDDDEPVFDNDLVELGVIWRLLKSIGQPYLEEKVEYDRMFEIAMAQSGGNEKLTTDGHRTALSNIPETGFGS